MLVDARAVRFRAMRAKQGTALHSCVKVQMDPKSASIEMLIYNNMQALGRDGFSLFVVYRSGAGLDAIREQRRENGADSPISDSR